MAREHRGTSFKRNLVSETSGPHTRRAKGDVPGYKYFKVRSSVYDPDGHEIQASVAREEFRTESEEAAVEKGFSTAANWAQSH